MTDLRKFHARICQTASGILVVNRKVLLVKHKKLGIWLGPGGHIEKGELPFEAAEREVWEETGIKVRAINPFMIPENSLSQDLPAPIGCNLHWICEENYRKRKATGKINRTAKWPLGCEQHMNSIYLVELLDKNYNLKLDPNESTDLRWFSKDELVSLDMLPNIRNEVKLAMEIYETRNL